MVIHSFLNVYGAAALKSNFEQNLKYKGKYNLNWKWWISEPSHLVPSSRTLTNSLTAFSSLGPQLMPTSLSHHHLWSSESKPSCAQALRGEYLYSVKSTISSFLIYLGWTTFPGRLMLSIIFFSPEKIFQQKFTSGNHNQASLHGGYSDRNNTRFW